MAIFPLMKRDGAGFAAGLTGGGGILSQLTGSGGILSQQTGILQARFATLRAAGTPQAKIAAFTGTLGQRLKTPGGFLGGTVPPGPAAPATDYRYAAAAQTAVSQLPPASSGRFT